MGKKKDNGGYRYTANDRDLRRSCPLTLVLLAGWPAFGVLAAVSAVKGWL
jgi:hypothetical protein